MIPLLTQTTVVDLSKPPRTIADKRAKSKAQSEDAAIDSERKIEIQREDSRMNERFPTGGRKFKMR